MLIRMIMFFSVFIYLVDHPLVAQYEVAPRHGVELQSGFSFQIPARVLATRGGNGIVSISPANMGSLYSIRYVLALTEHTCVSVGIQRESIPFRFNWKGPNKVLGIFDPGEDGPVGLPNEKWGNGGFGVGLRTEILHRERLTLSGGLDLLLARGSGTAGFSWSELNADSVEMKVFSYHADFNSDKTYLATLLYSVRLERIQPNYNRIFLALAFKWGLEPKVLAGNYYAITENGILSGEFHSALNAVELHLGYILTWGYPKVPKRLQ